MTELSEEASKLVHDHHLHNHPVGPTAHASLFPLMQTYGGFGFVD
jgi:hypothetical protein